MSTEDSVRSSGNVFADMGLDDADELLIRAQLGQSVRKILEEKGLKQRLAERIRVNHETTVGRQHCYPRRQPLRRGAVLHRRRRARWLPRASIRPHPRPQGLQSCLLKSEKS